MQFIIIVYVFGTQALLMVMACIQVECSCMQYPSHPGVLLSR
jgi:hypothetical protein